TNGALARRTGPVQGGAHHRSARRAGAHGGGQAAEVQAPRALLGGARAQGQLTRRPLLGRPSSARSRARSGGLSGLSRRLMTPSRLTSGGESGVPRRVAARAALRTHAPEVMEGPPPAPPSSLMPSPLPSSMATRGVTRLRLNQPSMTWRMVPPRS